MCVQSQKTKWSKASKSLPYSLDEELNQPLLNGFPASMVLLDCETTGGKATKDRITEVALLVVENGCLVKSWQTLIKPEMAIPPWVQRLTGISQEMVASAPTFSEIAPLIKGVCEGRVLVSHNARFDYGFLKNEFKRLDESFQTKTLCSVKLSRNLYPQYKRHGLDQIIRRLGFDIVSRHRAHDDTVAVWQFLKQVSQDFDAGDIAAVCQTLLKKPSLPSQLPSNVVDALPNRPGIYRFWQESKLLYVGKSVRIKERVFSHFTQDHANAKDLEMSRQITDVDCEETPTDFGAQLLESERIKLERPQHNRRLKKLTKLYQVRLYSDEHGYLRCNLEVAQTTAIEGENSIDESVYGLFRSRKQAESLLEKLCQRHQLCPRLMGLESKPTGPCFSMQLKKCLGACCQKEPIQSYNLRLQQAFKGFKKQLWPWDEAIIVVESSAIEPDFRHFHLINQWCYLQRFTKVQDLCDWLEDGTLPAEEPRHFDLDAYLILLKFLMKPSDQARQSSGLEILPVTEIQAKWTSSELCSVLP